MPRQDGPGLLQFRPARPGGPQSMDAMYSPARDLGWNFIPTATQVLESLAPQNWPDWVRAYATAHNVNENDIAACALSFASALELFADPEVESPQVALERSGFFNTAAAARDIFMMRLGQHITGAYFTAVRDLTCPNTPAPLVQQLHVMMQRAKEVVSCLDHQRSETSCESGSPTTSPDTGDCQKST